MDHKKMKLDIKVKNLGALKQGTVKIRPLTVLAGENGTGKSFFTKSLYSIFNVLNKNILHVDIINNIDFINFCLIIFINDINNKSKNDKDNVIFLQRKLKELQSILNTFKEKEKNIDAYIKFISSLHTKVDDVLQVFKSYLISVEKKPTKKISVSKTIRILKDKIDILNNCFKSSKDYYIQLLAGNLSNEIKENFQIANLDEIITFSEKECKISADGFNINLHKDDLIFILNPLFINKISNLSRVVFFESPAYWKVRDALHEAKKSPDLRTNDLIGVPKYFYDLDKALRTKSKNKASEDILQLSANLKQQVGGEFIFESGRLYFIDNKGRTIDKNLISFGMTNLGMLQALLKNNVIDKGSFVFFDEPETNLHPQWQVLLTRLIIKLAEIGVNVVIATHSLDIIKALEVETKNKEYELSDFMAINCFQKDATLLKFASDNVTKNLIQSREILSKPYEALYYQDAISD